ncbi:hypothetical protein EVAR_81377_1 [Eumeta japonica]|uniref:Uncharacterized protein n=1 Tax=Eumeta variegata TaxID=151549 RepID=A0A4C1WEI0_EUMVA|nr:hypothetical protein EVAR_81377_1 [Eumeta japonica]
MYSRPPWTYRTINDRPSRGCVESLSSEFCGPKEKNSSPAIGRPASAGAASTCLIDFFSSAAHYSRSKRFNAPAAARRPPPAARRPPPLCPAEFTQKLNLTEVCADEGSPRTI